MSLKKISELTGCSVATVSRVLNNPDYHCQEEGLSERILETARELNYVPNSSARQLKMGEDARKGFDVDVLLARFNSLGEDAFFEEV